MHMVLLDFNCDVRFQNNRDTVRLMKFAKTRELIISGACVHIYVQPEQATAWRGAIKKSIRTSGGRI